MLAKNTAGQYAVIYVHDTLADIPKTGYALASLAGKISKDGAAFVALGAPEPSVELGYGFYQLTLTQAETNYNEIIVTAAPASTQFSVQGFKYATDSGLKAETVVILADVTGINGEAMRGTDGVSLVVPATRAEATSDKDEIIVEVDANETKIDTAITDIAALNDTTAAEFVTALMADTGITAGGVWTYEEVMKVIVSILAGNIKDKTGSAGTYEILDPDDETTVIAELTPATSTPYRNLTIL